MCDCLIRASRRYRKRKKQEARNKMNKKGGTMPKDQRICKEGFMTKRVGVLKLWKSRYFVLLDDVICYFLKEEQKETYLPTGRIFFNDIQAVDRVKKKSHPHAMFIETSTKKHIMSCASYEEREDWVNKLWEATESYKNKEKHDPIRRRSSKLGKDFKRITIKKDPKHGIGCTIKNVGGAIFVSRIIPDGPVATSGVLRPGDQIIDINGNRVSECPIEKIKEIIKSSPEYIICTVKPITHYTSHEDSPGPQRTAYTEVDPDALQNSDGEDENNDLETNYITVEISAKSMEDLCRMDSTDDRHDSITHKENTNGRHANHADVPSHRVPLTVTENGAKKQTNYAELDFSSK